MCIVSLQQPSLARGKVSVSGSSKSYSGFLVSTAFAEPTSPNLCRSAVSPLLNRNAKISPLQRWITCSPASLGWSSKLNTNPAQRRATTDLGLSLEDTHVEPFPAGFPFKQPKHRTLSEKNKKNSANSASRLSSSGCSVAILAKQKGERIFLLAVLPPGREV